MILRWTVLFALLLCGCGGTTEGTDPATSSDGPGVTTGEADQTEQTGDVETDDTGDRSPIGTRDPNDEAPPSDTTSEPPTDNTDPPTASTGCGATDSPADGLWSLTHDGDERSFLVHLPSGYDGSTPTPIVINYHGRSMNGSGQAAFSEMNPVADANDFIVVYPNGTGSTEQTWNAGVCCGSAQANNIDDVGFTAAMLDELESNLCVDADRIFTVGMSNGGFMSHRIGCELSDRITAIGAVAGTMGVFDCSPARPVPVLHFHGTADRVVPYNGFVGPDSADAAVDTWRDLNGCGSGEVYYAQGDVTCERWTGCDQGAEVRFCTIDGGGHTWPGGTDFTFGALGAVTDDISASEHFWEFFSQFSL